MHNLTTEKKLCLLLIYMPTEYKPGNVDKSSSDSIVDVLSNSNLPVLHSDFTPKNTSPKQNSKPQVPKKTNAEPKKHTFFDVIGTILTSDILWFSVAFACLLATILFYFQVLQPLVLQKYIDNAQAQIIESNQKFISQVNQLTTLQQNITNNLRTATGDPCTEEAKYTQSEKDQKNLQGLKDSLSIDSKLNNLPNFYIYSDQETKRIYSSFISDYNTSLNDLKPVVDQTKQSIDLADYKNTWIDSCISINNSKGDIKELQAICQNISNKANFYNKIGSKAIVDLLAKPLEDSNNLCKEILASKSVYYSQFGNFQLKWLSIFDIVNGLSITPDQSSMDAITTDFQNSVARKQDELNTLLEKRTEFNNIWYILELNFR